MAANIDALLQEAQSALTANRKADARHALDTALSIDERSESAWLLMSQVVDTESDQLTCLENALAINPNNAQARQRAAAIQSGSRPTPFSAATPAAPPFPDAPDSGGWGDWAGMDIPIAVPSPPSKASIDNSQSSVEWGHPADPAPTGNRAVGQPSDEDYDSWMAGLSLGGSNSSGGKAGSAKRQGDGGLVPAFDTSDFDSGPFSTTSFEPLESDSGSGSSSSTAAAGRSATASPFGGFGFDESLAAPSDTAAAHQDTDPFGLRRGSAGNSSALPAAQPPATARPAFSLKGAEPPALAAARKRQGTEQTYDEYQDQFQTDAETDKKMNSAAPVSGAVTIEPPSSSAAVFTTIDSTPGMANPSSYFSAIPSDIRNSNRLKPALVASLIGLLVINLVSWVLLLSNLAASGIHPVP